MTILPNFPSVSSVDVVQAGYVGLMAGKRTIVPGLFNKITILALAISAQPRSFMDYFAPAAEAGPAGLNSGFQLFIE